MKTLEEVLRARGIEKEQIIRKSCQIMRAVQWAFSSLSSAYIIGCEI
jgi:hypothetical protein